MNGSRISSIVPGSGMSEGLWTSSSSPFVSVTSNSHRGHRRQQLEVVLALQALAHDVHVQQARGSRSGSRSPSASEVSGSHESAASLSVSFSSASRRSG